MTQVSFIVTIDHQAAHLDAMLKSLRDQMGDFSHEFIFVDDGSTDGSFDALIEKTRCWPRTMLIQQRRQGPTIAALTGARAATGDHLFFVDGDTVLAPFAVRHLLETLRQLELDMILVPHTVVDDPAQHGFGSGDRIPDVTPLAHPTLALLTRRQLPPWRMFIRRGVFRDPGFFAPSVFLSDFYPPLAVSRGEKLAIWPAVLSVSTADAPSLQRRLKGQTAHDRSAAVAAFLAAHPDIPARYRRAALRGCARRAWLASRQSTAAGLTARFFWLYIKAILGMPMDVTAVLAQCLTAWTDENLQKPVGKT